MERVIKLRNRLPRAVLSLHPQKVLKATWMWQLESQDSSGLGSAGECLDMILEVFSV